MSNNLGENITPFASKIWLSSPTMHGDEQKWVNDAFVKNWITTAGENINEVSGLSRIMQVSGMQWHCPAVLHRCTLL